MLFLGEILMLGASSGGESPLVVIVGFGLFFSLIVLFIYGITYLEKKRRQNFIDRCQKDGLKYTAESKYIPKCKDVIFSITSRGYSHRYSVIVSGERGGIVFSTLDFYYHVGGKNGGRCKTLCVLFKPGIVFPSFYVRTENSISDWIGEKLGGQDIDFDEDADFSDKFVLQGSNEKMIRLFFDGKVRKAFVAVYPNDYEFESAGNYLLVCKQGYIDYDGRLKMLSDAVSIFSTFMKHENEGNLAWSSFFI